MNFEYPEGATPIDGDELAGLIPDIFYQHELNQFERDNIERANAWAQRSRKLKAQLLTSGGILLLHKKMFEDVWRWAGTYRSTEKNIGISPSQIPETLHNLCLNTKYQINHRTLDGGFDWSELAIRFHHHLVKIHPFPNGNGRTSRTAADMLLYYHGQPSLSWGASPLQKDSEIRREYIQSLRGADRGNFEPLLKFAKKP